MIRTEVYDGLTRTYSDAGLKVVRDGISYDEAVDPTELGRVYTEGEPIEDTEASATEILDILLGEIDD